jgi:hypothetical protein
MLLRACVLGFLSFFLLPGCGAREGKAGSPQKKGGETSFASDREESGLNGAEAKPVAFDGDRAMRYLKAVCKIGPRVSGTAGMKKQQDLLVKHFKKFKATVTRQTFKVRPGGRGKPVEMTNLIFSWHPKLKRRVLLCSHYDTRPVADQEPNRRDWHKPFLSANDGGSGLALLMELAHHLKDMKTALGVDFVFFDAEEYIFAPGTPIEQYCLGSKHFAQVYLKSRPKYRYVAGVLLDMVGAKGARFPVEANSNFQAGGVVRQLWGIAAELKCSAFVNRVGDPDGVVDDHLPLNRAGIPTADIIQWFPFPFKHWHRLADKPENCSADTLEQVAKVLSVWLQRLK